MFKYINFLLLAILLLIFSCDEELKPVIEGCTNETACNYNSDATMDDDSCTYAEENYDCDGNCTNISCAYTILSSSISNNILDVNYESNYPIAGFQFTVQGATINSAGGGAAEAADLKVQNSDYMVLAFSLTGSSIYAGSGTLILVDLTPTGGDIVLSNIVFSSPEAEPIPTCFDDGEGCEPSYEQIWGCMDPSACDFDPEVTILTGCDYGTMCWDGSYSCDADDCPDQPGGTVEINYNSDTDIAGFQFNVTGVTVTVASGGAAEAAGFMISSSASTVLGLVYQVKPYLQEVVCW